MTGKGHSGSLALRQPAFDKRIQGKKACKDGRRDRVRSVAVDTERRTEVTAQQLCDDKLYWQFRKHCHKAWEKLSDRSAIQVCQYLDALRNSDGVSASQLVYEEKFDEVKDLVFADSSLIK